MTDDAGLSGRPAAGDAAVWENVPWRTLAAIAIVSFLTCAAVDLAYFGPTVVSGDEERFLAAAAHLLSTGEFRVGQDVAWEMPGTALFFAPFLYLFPASGLTAIRLAQGGLLALQAVTLGALASVIFRDYRAGILAALMAGFYPYLLFTQGLALSETLFMFLLSGAFLSLYVWRSRGTRIDHRLLVAMALFVLATMTKATLTVLAPLLVAAGAVGVQPVGEILRILAVAIALYCLLMSPWWIRNGVALGTFVPFTTSASQNLYMGNSPTNPEAATYPPALPDNWAVDRGVNLAAIPDELERSRAFRDRALAHILADPAGFIRRAVGKFLTFWNLMPNAIAYQSPLYRWLGLLSFGPVLLFAIVSLLQQRANLVLFLPFTLFAAYLTALYVVTIASIRYRLPLEPLMIVLAAGPIARLSHKLVPAGRIPLEAVRAP